MSNFSNYVKGRIGVLPTAGSISRAGNKIGKNIYDKFSDKTDAYTKDTLKRGDELIAAAKAQRARKPLLPMIKKETRKIETPMPLPMLRKRKKPLDAERGKFYGAAPDKVSTSNKK